MERILEPEYMDTVEEAEGYDAMDHDDANRDVVDTFLGLGGGPGTTLDLGTGPGDIPILIVRAHPEARVVGVDAAATMLRIARAKVAAQDLGDRIRFQQADVKRLPYRDGCFDAVFSNTILHHIPEPLEFLREAWRVLRPGGVLCIRDLYRPATESEAWAIVDRYAAGGTEVQRRLFFDSLHAALTLDEARAAAREAGMVGVEVEMSSDRHYTIRCP